MREGGGGERRREGRENERGKDGGIKKERRKRE